MVAHPHERGRRAQQKKRRYAIIACGSRHWRDEQAVYRALKPFPPGTIVIHGDQASWDPETRSWYGADYLIDRVARKLGLEVLPIPYLHEEGRAGGPRRNGVMLAVLLALGDVCTIGVLAFDMGGRGTADMVRQASDVAVKIKRIEPAVEGQGVEPST